jgi:hypothetical protein
MKVADYRTQRNNEIIDTMLQQLGGGRFFVMTGSKPQYKEVKDTESPAVTIKLARNKSRAQYMRLQYQGGLDTYKMEFKRMTPDYDIVMVDEYEGLYAEDLQETFTQVTGLYTRL